MSVLVCESSPSYNEFTRLLLCPVPEWSFQARVANVAQGGSVITQHTQYQLVVTAVPRNSIDMDVRCFSLWTRFRDLSHLWSQLSKIHQQLYLHGTFPTFAPAKFFGNSEPSVIAERIEATGRFLNFVLASEVLRKTRVLHQFFAAAEEVSSQIDSTPPLSSTNVASSSAAHILESESIERQEVGGEIEAETEVSPNTTTPYPRSDEFSEVSLMNTSSSTASAGISGTLASSQSMSSSTTSCLFDFPDIHVQSAAASTADLSDQTVHSTVLSEYLYVPTQGDSSRPVTTSGAASVQHHSIIERILPKIFSPNANVAEQSSTAVLQPRREASFYSVVGVASFSGDVSRSSSTPRLDALSTSARSSPVRHDTALVNPHNDYLVQAAQFISTAQKAENERAFELAFHCYKSAVSALLQGVQYERDLSRRNAVRKKTAKYLLKAEKLYRSYLSFDGSAFDVNSWLSNTVHDPNLIAFQMSNAALKSYRIVGILPSASAKHRVLLVEERNAGSEMRYVMKLLEKSANVWCSRQQRTPASSCTIVPMHIANMVQLHKFFDIDNFIILLLEYVKHGTLWDFLEDYFEECGRKIRIFMETEIFKNDFRDCELRDKTTPSAKGGHWDERLAEVASYAPDEVTAGPSSVVNSTGLRTKPNAYEGRHVRFSVGGEGDEPMDLAGESTFDQLLGKHTDKMSVSSWDSGTSLCGASVPIGGEGSASSAHAPFEAVLQGTVTEAAVDCFSLDEEAPAPVNLSTRSATSSSNANDSCAIGDELDLVEALERAKKRLQRGKRWSRNEHLPESLLVHWMAQLVSAVYLLHSQGIVLRDLRPDNLLIDENADLKLTFCSQWHDVDARADESAISECYAAPELLSVTQTIAEAADRWSIGAIMFERVCGQKLAHLCPHGLATAITIPIPDCVDISFAARDLLSRLLLVNPLERLSDDDLRAHPFFSDCDWRVYDGTMPAVKASFQSSNSHIE